MTGRSCLGMAGIAWSALCLFFVSAGIGDMIAGNTIGGPMAIFFGFLALGGFVMMFQGFRKVDPKAMSHRDKERLVLEIARSHDGELTIEELAVDSDLSAFECKEILDVLAEVGTCDTWVGRHGETIYVFRGFLLDGRPKRSFDPMKGDVELQFDELAAEEQAEARRSK